MEEETSNYSELHERRLLPFHRASGYNDSVLFEVEVGGDGANMTQMSLSNGSQIRVPYRAGPPTRSRLYRDMEVVDYYTSPLIVVLGVLSNFLAYIVFTRTRLRKVASVPYLAAMAVTDSGALITDFIQKGLLKHNIFIISMSGICQFTTYFSYVFIFLSIWYPLALCVEKFICVYCPLRKASLCTPFRAKVVVISMAVLTGTCYYYVIYMYGPNYRFGIVSCSAWMEVTQDMFILMALDTVFACGVPCIILVVLVILIFARGCEYYRISSAGERTGQGRLRDSGGISCAGGGRSNSRRGQSSGGAAALRSFRGARMRSGPSASSASASSSSSSLQAPVRVTNVIFPVVGMTLILQFPTFAFRFMFSVFKLEREVLIRLTDYQPLFIYMNNLAWAIKFYIYLISSPSFRRRTRSLLVNTWRKLKASGWFGRRRRRNSLEEREEGSPDGAESRILTNRPINMAERWEHKKAYGRQRTDV